MTIELLKKILHLNLLEVVQAANFIQLFTTPIQINFQTLNEKLKI